MLLPKDLMTLLRADILFSQNVIEWRAIETTSNIIHTNSNHIAINITQYPRQAINNIKRNKTKHDVDFGKNLILFFDETVCPESAEIGQSSQSSREHRNHAEGRGVHQHLQQGGARGLHHQPLSASGWRPTEEPDQGTSLRDGQGRQGTREDTVDPARWMEKHEEGRTGQDGKREDVF